MNYGLDPRIKHSSFYNPSPAHNWPDNRLNFHQKQSLLYQFAPNQSVPSIFSNIRSLKGSPDNQSLVSNISSFFRQFFTHSPTTDYYRPNTTVSEIINSHSYEILSAMDQGIASAVNYLNEGSKDVLSLIASTLASPDDFPPVLSQMVDDMDIYSQLESVGLNYPVPEGMQNLYKVPLNFIFELRAQLRGIGETMQEEMEATGTVGKETLLSLVETTALVALARRSGTDLGSLDISQR